MTEKVEIGNCTLYHGDAQDILPAPGVIDAVITDPVWPNCPDGLIPGADGNQHQLLERVLRSCLEVQTICIVLGFDSDPRFLKAVPPGFRFIRSQQLPYAVPGYRGRLLGGDEVVYIFGEIPKGRGVIPGRAPVEATTKASRATNHPCPRSDKHMTSLVGWWSREAVLDPFMGTGATGVACAHLGRRFVGIEINLEYFDIACERIEAAHAQGRLFA